MSYFKDDVIELTAAKADETIKQSVKINAILFILKYLLKTCHPERSRRS